MNRSIFLFVLAALTIAGGVGTAVAQSRTYAGRVTQIYPRDGRAEVRRGGSPFTLRRGDSLFDGDCVRPIRAGTSVTVRQDDNRSTTIAYAGEQCSPIQTRNAASDRFWRYVSTVLAPLQRSSRPTRQAGSNRGAGDIEISGMYVRPPRPLVKAGTRSLTLVWCVPHRLRFVVRGPAGRAPRYQNARDLTGAVQLDPIDFTPGIWTIDIYVLGGDLLDSVEIEVVAQLPPPPAPPAQPMPSLEALERAGNLARSDPQGRLDFEAIQTGVEDFNVQDRAEAAQATFCHP